MKNFKILFLSLLALIAFSCSQSKVAFETKSAVKTDQANYVPPDNVEMATLAEVANPAVPPKTYMFEAGILPSGFEWTDVISILLALASLSIGSLLAKAKLKLRQTGNLLVKIADAIDDNKIDANERTDLSKEARAIIGLAPK